MIDLLKQYGFTYRGTCNCAGPRTEKWKHGEYTIYWNKKTARFRLKKFGKPLTILLPDTQLEETLKKFLTNAQAA